MLALLGRSLGLAGVGEMPSPDHSSPAFDLNAAAQATLVTIYRVDPSLWYLS